jgi:hypothetical protein
LPIVSLEIGVSSLARRQSELFQCNRRRPICLIHAAEQSLGCGANIGDHCIADGCACRLVRVTGKMNQLCSLWKIGTGNQRVIAERRCSKHEDKVMAIQQL